MKENREGYTLVVAPAADSKNAFWVPDETAQEFRNLSNRMGFLHNDQDGKLYLDLPRTAPPTPVQENGEGVYYPSGAYLKRHPDNNEDKYGVIDWDAAPPLVQGEDKVKIGRFYTLGEFRPKSSEYDGVRVSPRLIEALDKIREKAGQPIRVTSAYRPIAYNKAVGGVPSSTHIDGLAADIYSDGLTTEQLYDIADEVIRSTGGVGYYPREKFVHVDVRGSRSRW